MTDAVALTKREWIARLASLAETEKLEASYIAVSEWPSVELWIIRVECLLAALKRGAVTANEVLAEFRTANNMLRLWLPSSQVVWELCLGFVQKHFPEDEKALFQSRLGTPHTQIDDTSLQYSSFISRVSDDTYEKNMLAMAKTIAATKKLILPRESRELQLAQTTDPNARLAFYKRYLAWELAQFSSSGENFCQALFDRAISEHPHDGELWTQYVWHCWLDIGDLSRALEICDRALLFCATCATLWSIKLSLLNELNRDEGLIIAKSQFDENFAEGQDSVDLTYLCCLSNAVSKGIIDIEMFDEVVTSLLSAAKRSLDTLYVSATILCKFGLPERAKKLWDIFCRNWKHDEAFWKLWYAWAQNTQRSTFPSEDAYPDAVLKYCFKETKSSSSLHQYLRREALRQCLINGETRKVEVYRRQLATFSITELPSHKRGLDGDTGATKKQKVQDENGNNSRDREKSSIIVSGQIDASDLEKKLRKCSIRAHSEVNGYHLIELASKYHKSEALATLKFDDSAPIEAYDASETSLWVTNFPESWGEADIQREFGPFGKIVSVRFPSDRSKRRFCYVQYLYPQNAHTAVNNYRNEDVIVKISDPENRTPRQGTVDERREVFFSKLDYGLSEPQVRDFIDAFTCPESIRVPFKQDNRSIAGFAFAVYSTHKQATEAVTLLNGRTLGGMKIRASIAQRRSGALPRNKIQVTSRNEREHKVILAIVPGGMDDGTLTELVSPYGKTSFIERDNDGSRATIHFESGKSAATAEISLDGISFKGFKIEIVKRQNMDMKPRVLL